MYLGGHFCHLGCPLCPPDSGGGIDGSGGDSGDGDSNTQTESSTSSSSTSDESAAFTVFAMGTTYFADPLPTTDALDALEAIASAEAGLMQSLYGSEISFAETATNTMIITSTPAATTTSPTGFAYSYTQSDGYIVGCPTDILVVLGDNYPETVCVSGVTIGQKPTTLFTSTQTDGYIVACLSDVTVTSSGTPETVCMDWTTIGDVVTTTTTVTHTATPTPTPTCTVYGWNNNTQAFTDVPEYRVGWALWQDGEFLAELWYGNDNPCAYHPALLDSPLPEVIEWYGEGCVPELDNCMINYGSQRNVYGKTGAIKKDNAVSSDDRYYCYVEFECPSS